MSINTANVTSQEWDQKFNRWVKGPADTEQEQCDNAERMVREAINNHPAFKNRAIEVFAQGSYRNRTNVRAESDVDVCVRCTDALIADYSLVPEVKGTLGFTDSEYGFSDLKRDVEAALVKKFGTAGIATGDKAFDIKENTYRVSADVVPTFEGRLYYRDGEGRLKFLSGTALWSAKRGVIHNWPEQHHANGVQKHEETGKQFKKQARALKNLSNDMAGAGVASAKLMKSFLLESLVYNCPTNVFGHDTYAEDAGEVILHLWNAIGNEAIADKMVEVNGVKYLFRDSQPWKKADVRTFLSDAWGYAGFTR